MAHVTNPYPTECEKATIISDTGIEARQLSNWFTNNRKRFWKPLLANMKHNTGDSSNSDEMGGMGGMGEHHLADPDAPVITDVTDLDGVITRSEIVDVFILDPSDGNYPSIGYVSIQTPKFDQTVLKTYHKCDLVYSFHKSVATSRKKVQSRRDAEVVSEATHISKPYGHASHVHASHTHTHASHAPASHAHASHAHMQTQATRTQATRTQATHTQ